MIVMSSIIFYGCEIELYKSFFSEEYSDMLFNLLKSETEWVQNEIVIFGKNSTKASKSKYLNKVRF